MSIELVLVVPLLVWALLSTFVYFDVFRVEANSNRASLTLAEMFSRETTPITSEFLNSAREVLRTLTFEESSPDYRVTVYRYRPSDDSYLRVWSRHRGLDQTLRNEDLALLQSENKLPKMNSIDHAILIETRIEYDAPFSIGLSRLSQSFGHVQASFASTHHLATVTTPAFNVALEVRLDP